MSRRLGVTAGVVVLVVAFLVGRPYGDALLHTLSGGSRYGALLIGLAHFLLPLGVAIAYVLPQYGQLAAGVDESDLRRSAGLATAFWISFVPAMVMPFLVSRSGPDTPLEQSALFGWFLAGVFGGLVLAVPVAVVLRARREAAVRVGARVRDERFARSAASRSATQTPDKVRRRRKGR